MAGIVALIARIFLSFIFLVSGLKKIFKFDTTAEKMAAKGIPLPEVFLLGAVIFLIVGGLSVALGYKARLGAILLIVFLIPVTLLFHGDIGNAGQQTQLMKNLGLMGGLLLIIANGSGKLSLKR